MSAKRHPPRCVLCGEDVPKGEAINASSEEHGLTDLWLCRACAADPPATKPIDDTDLATMLGVSVEALR